MVLVSTGGIIDLCIAWFECGARGLIRGVSGLIWWIHKVV